MAEEQLEEYTAPRWIKKSTGPNRAKRTLMASLARKAKGKKEEARDPYRWHKRVIKSMIENKEVMEKVVNGSFDKFLG